MGLSVIGACLRLNNLNFNYIKRFPDIHFERLCLIFKESP